MCSVSVWSWGGSWLNSGCVNSNISLTFPGSFQNITQHSSHNLGFLLWIMANLKSTKANSRSVGVRQKHCAHSTLWFPRLQHPEMMGRSSAPVPRTVPEEKMAGDKHYAPIAHRRLRAHRQLRMSGQDWKEEASPSTGWFCPRDICWSQWDR